MSSKRKEKKIKGTDTVPLPPPHRNSKFFLNPSEIFQRCMKGGVTVNPLGNDFQSPPTPIRKSGGGGNGSRYLNGIDHNSFMVREGDIGGYPIPQYRKKKW